MAADAPTRRDGARKERFTLRRMHVVPFLPILLCACTLYFQSIGLYLPQPWSFSGDLKLKAPIGMVPNTHDFRVCMESNNVLMRNSIGNNDTRPFSLGPQDFVSHHTHECSSVQDFLSAVKFGLRRWENQVVLEDKNLSLVDKENFPSFFVPHGCDVPALSQERMCAIMSRFSHVTIVGDSQLRHVQGGLHTGLKNDFVSGAMVTSDPVRKDKCSCDGQFSEHVECRTLDPSFYRFQPQQAGICPKLHHNETNQVESFMHTVYHRWKGFDRIFDGVDCSKEEDRGMLLILNGGFHFGNKADRTYNHFRPIWQHPVVNVCAQYKKLIVIWGSSNTQSPSMDERYPHQSPQHGIIFNQQMQELFDSNGMENVTTIDWMNFTKGAQTSDGVHYLMNVNFFKAQQLLLLADLMLDEGMFYRKHSPVPARH
jgi:hypothetical protein